MTIGPDLLHLHMRRRSSVPDSKSTKKPYSKLDKLAQSRTIMDNFRKLPASMQNVLKRTVFCIILLGYFVFVIYGGPITILLTTLAAQVKCFYEIIAIAYKKHDISTIPNFKYIANYFLVSANIYFGGETIIEYFGPFINLVDTLNTLATYHRFFSFCFYFIGVMWFVLSLKKHHYRKQFSLLAWTHVILLVLVVQSYLIAKTIFQGMIWFIICITTITVNDIMAYICGRFFGRTPLISLSPKKTWEGFIGAGIFTILITCSLAYFLCGNEFLICPIEYRQINYEIVKITQCTPDDMFQLMDFPRFGVQMYPFVIHAFWFSVFGSLVAPFGGFFASGFKRAFKVKDFGDTIPGHGGIMDRFDCQLVMITFVNVYITSFVGGNSANRSTQDIFHRILTLRPEDQLELYYMLKGSLVSNGIRL
ncbi:PREDICTED: phosphatidate cytidylyltransferase, photoreceptor-specific-like [Nicrophorus vespilloides]|uniref:Phosphatidate cytidylyltransferase n=1 Tax=Nicrophorus vespilloides TaxID=110193 RepID=A0ABM1MTK9_NICVS|nr:PREDICTED: phosphatidate cytidylyltransferase, photoreceptor-specific-like [Nicrophorus vespilloides]XP_017777910.1 PREDICTED: phosphatidate cytidylyltransferase, photoreceptor-specific-like [Nicrophorus vespilloides]